nr:FAD-dependent oxidoreductase [Advenella sp. FME57]
MPTSVNVPTVVIGAGLAGLAASLALARAGHNVVLVEAGETFGGCCSATHIDGFTFNNGAMYVAVPSLLRHGFQRLGLDFEALVPLQGITRPMQSHLDDGTVVHLTDASNSWVAGPRGEQREQSTQILRVGLNRLQTQWGPIYRKLIHEILPQEPSLWHSLRHLGLYLPRMGGRVDSLIKTYFPDVGLQAAVSATLLYTGIAADKLPATQIIGLLALLEEGFHLPSGGMSAIGEALYRHLPPSNVSIRWGQRVVRIEMAADKVCAVVLTNGERLQTQRILTTISGFDVVRNLLPQNAVPQPLTRIANRTSLSHRAVSIQLGCSGVEFPNSFMINHVPGMEHQGRMHRTVTTRPDYCSYSVPTQVLPDLAPDGKQIIEMFAPVSSVDSASGWTPQMTDKAVQLHVDALRHRMPGMQIESMRVMDPDGFVRQRHLYEGALYGVAPGTPPHHFFPHRSGIGGLYLAGQTTFPGYGVSTAVWSGIQAAHAMIQDKQRRPRR